MHKKQIISAILFSTGVFIFSLILGYVTALLYPEVANIVIKSLSEEFAPLKGKTDFETFIFIFINNSSKALIVLLGGILFSIIPIIFLFINGEIVGLLMQTVKLNVGWLQVLLLILPHGIIEIPAIIFSAGLGVWLGYRFFRRLFFHESFREAFKWSMFFFAKIILPMLLLAALIEAFLTKRLADFII